MDSFLAGSFHSILSLWNIAYSTSLFILIAVWSAFEWIYHNLFSILLLMAIWVFLAWGNCKCCCYELSYTCLLVNNYICISVEYISLRVKLQCQGTCMQMSNFSRQYQTVSKPQLFQGDHSWSWNHRLRRNSGNPESTFPDFCLTCFSHRLHWAQSSYLIKEMYPLLFISLSLVITW